MEDMNTALVVIDVQNAMIEEELRSRNVEGLILVGMSTAYCVDATCRGAAERGYGVTLVGDAHTSESDEVQGMMGQDHVSAEQVVAHHNFLLANLHNARPDRRISVKRTAEIEFSNPR